MALYIPLRYKVEFNLTNSPKDMTFTDSIAGAYLTTYGQALANIKGLLKITGPDGVVYINSGYTTNNFGSPDINGASPTWSKTVDLPLDSDGMPLEGEYLFEYKLSINAGVGVYTTVSYTYNYGFVNPTPNMNFAFASRYSIITVTDTTIYAVDGISPNNDLDTDRDWTVHWPNTAGSPPPIPDTTGHLATLTLGPNVWTGPYIVELFVDLHYQMEAWSDLSDKFVVITSISGEWAETVEDDSCVCQLYDCFRTIEARYEGEVQNGDRVAADRLKTQMSLLAFYFTIYTIAKSCDKDAGWACDKISEIAFYEGCNCEQSSQTASVEVIPWDSIIPVVAGTGTVWYDGAGAPSGGLGKTDDYYLRTSNGDIYKKLVGTWTVIANITGPTGTTDSGLRILVNNIGNYGTSAGTTEEDLISYTVDNTPDPVLANDGDILRVEAYATFGINDNSKTVKLYFGGTSIVTYFTDSDVITETNGVLIQMEITRINANSQFIQYNITRNGLHGGTVGPLSTTATKDLTADQVVKITGQNGTAQANDIVAKYLKVEYIPIIV